MVYAIFVNKKNAEKSGEIEQKRHREKLHMSAVLNSQ